MIETSIEIRDIGRLAREVGLQSATPPMNCLQCQKCSSGCPIAFKSDLGPHVLVRLVQMDQKDAVITSRFIWECTSCQTCVTRCPQQIDIPAMNDAFRAVCRAEGHLAAGTVVPVFNELFMNAICSRGRISEMSLMAAFKIRTRDWFSDMGKFPMMFFKGKLSFKGPLFEGRAARKAMFRRALREGDL
jgi:heterodisulfide reductase subunit C